MNTSPFLRILWKEYRAQRSFWISVAAAIAMIDLVVLADSWIPRADRTLVLFSLALVLAALYTLGSVATLFATERENETYDILRASPIGPWTVFFGKTLYALSARRPCLASPGRSPAFWPANCRTSAAKNSHHPPAVL